MTAIAEPSEYYWYAKAERHLEPDTPINRWRSGENDWCVDERVNEYARVLSIEIGTRTPECPTMSASLLTGDAAAGVAGILAKRRLHQPNKEGISVLVSGAQLSRQYERYTLVK